MVQFFDNHPFDIVQILDKSTETAIYHIYISKVDAVFKILNLKEGSKVLDVGCGTGYASLSYNGFFDEKMDVVGVDLSEVSVKLANEYSKSLNRNYKFITGNAMDLPFEDNEFDAAFCICLLHHLENHLDAIKEMSRVAKKICCVEPNNLNPLQIRYQKTEVAKRSGDTKAFYLNDLIKDFQAVGLKNIKTSRLHFIHPKAKGIILKTMILSEPILLKTPIINQISGGLVVCGER